MSVEIAAETARENLDAMALGLRYLELEVNCREVTEAFGKLRTQNLALLNDSRKVKLKVLEDALKLSNTIQASVHFTFRRKINEAACFPQRA